MRNNTNEEKIWNIEIIALSIILFVMLWRNVSNIHTIWEIPDEGGYLFNASLFSKNNWKNTFSNMNAYYGFGYSLILIPLFYICHTGEMLIQGCITVNIFCLLGIYFIQIHMMKELYNDVSKKIFPLISFAVCLYPYLVSNTLKVTCEVFLTLQFWIIILNLYNALKYKEIIKFILLGCSTIYIYFIHTRAVVISLVVCGLIIILFCGGKIKKRNLFFFFISICITFVIFYIIKNYIISILGTGYIIRNIETSKELNNVISLSFITDRIKWIFMKENIFLYVICAITKLFYLIVATGGFFGWGIIVSINEGRHLVKMQAYDNKRITKMFCFFAFAMMWAACCVSGVTKDYRYMIYGRYYEFCSMPIIIMGILYLLDNFRLKDLFLNNFILIVMGIITKTASYYVASEEINVDTARISGISYAVKNNEIYSEVVYWLILFTFACNCFYLISQKKEWFKYIIIVFFMMMLLSNDQIVIDTILNVNEGYISDLDISNYIMENIENEKIYFVYEQFRYDTFYQRMQVFLKEYSLSMIFPKEIDELGNGVFLITYINSEKAQELKENSEWKYIMGTRCYELFEK